jgi:hypothetical protein
MNSDMGCNVVALHGGRPTSTPSAGQAQVVGALPADMNIAKMVLFTTTRGQGQLQKMFAKQRLGICQKRDAEPSLFHDAHPFSIVPSPRHRPPSFSTNTRMDTTHVKILRGVKLLDTTSPLTSQFIAF